MLKTNADSQVLIPILRSKLELENQLQILIEVCMFLQPESIIVVPRIRGDTVLNCGVRFT